MQQSNNSTIQKVCLPVLMPYPMILGLHDHQTKNDHTVALMDITPLLHGDEIWNAAVLQRNLLRP
eukprot:5011403-Ditylum_brightwellii.AAC.1